MLVRALTLPGAYNGILFYLRPDFARLSDSKVWVDAFFQVFMSYGCSLGLATSLGSFNKPANKSYRDSIMICVMNSLTSVFAGFAVFGFLGFMAEKSEKTIDQVAAAGPQLAFITYPIGG